MAKPTKKKIGRKSLYQEIQIKQRFAALAPKAFAVMERLLDSDDINDQKWAVEQCAKGFARMIPQEVGGIGGAPVQVQVIDFSNYKLSSNTSLPKVITD